MLLRVVSRDTLEGRLIHLARHNLRCLLGRCRLIHRHYLRNWLLGHGCCRGLRWLVYLGRRRHWLRCWSWCCYRLGRCSWCMHSRRLIYRRALGCGFGGWFFSLR